MNELNLVVTENIAGKLSTNIKQLAEFVKERLTDYTPEKYDGDAASAKKARSELNNAKKQISQSRIALMTELMKPYEEFETECKNLEKDIDTASKQLDAIVKVRENEEKDAKKKIIQLTWNEKKFEMFSLEKIFVSQWLNKSYKLTDISAEMDAIIQRTYNDLKVIEKYSDDAETLKAMYLETLNIADTLDRGEELKKNREKIAAEKTERESREHEEIIKAQSKEVVEEFKLNESAKKMSSLVAEALETEIVETPKTYVLSFDCTKDMLVQIKNYLSMNGVKINSFEEISF